MRRELLLGVMLFCAAACGSRTGLEPPEWFKSTGTAASGGRGGAAHGGSTASGAAGLPTGGSLPGGSGGGGGIVLDFGGSAGSAGGPPCVGGPRPEVCNGVDDDCDGEIDEDLDLNVQDGPVVVRLDEGRTDVGLPFDCSSCGWAWTPQLVAPGGNLGMVWYLGVWGGSEQPNGFYRRLGPNLELESEVTSLGPQYWLGTLRPAQLSDGGGSQALATIQHSGSQNQPVFAALNRDYAIGNIAPLSDCSAASYGDMIGEVMPEAVACASPGKLHVFSVDTSDLTLTNHAWHVVRDNDADKTDVAGRAVGAQGLNNAGVIAWPVSRAGVGMAATELWSLGVVRNGNAVGDPYRRVLSEYPGLSLEGLFSKGTGFLLFGDYRNSGMWPRGRFVVTLGPDGDVTDTPRYFDGGQLQGSDQIAVTRDGAGFVLVVARGDALIVEQLDQDGSPRRHLTLDAKAYSEPSLLRRNGSLYIGYAEAPDAQKQRAPNRVMALRLGCD